jgi:hypothetical protein
LSARDADANHQPERFAMTGAPKRRTPWLGVAIGLFFLAIVLGTIAWPMVDSFT